MTTDGERWAFWLETQLEDLRWTQAELVRQSGIKENGRPVIDAPRVTAWLKEKERPSYRLAVAAAKALNVAVGDALRAAGYDVGEDNVAEQNRRPEGEVDRSPVGRSADPDAVLALDDMTPEQRAEVRRFAEFIRSQNPHAR